MAFAPIPGPDPHARYAWRRLVRGRRRAVAAPGRPSVAVRRAEPGHLAGPPSPRSRRAPGFVHGLLAAVSVAGGHVAQPLLGQNPPVAPAPETGDARTIPIPLPRISGPIELDGIVDEPAWDDIEPLPITVFGPDYGAPPTEITDVRVAHDDRFVYVGGRLYDSEPEAVRTNTYYRDRYSGDDALAIIFDSYNDYETAVWFVTNPAGNRTDRTIFNDAQMTPRAGMPSNADWNAYWDVATSRSDEGWFAEFRIPFSTLGFQVRGDEVTMGMIMYRIIARKNERHTFPDLDPRWGGIAFAKPSQAQRVTLRGVSRSTPVHITPYVLGGVRQTPELVDDGVANAAWRTEREQSREVGLDVKYTPTSNLALNVTINTDFAQVEADSAQVNLERFALFIPEKRQFFQERSATFDFNTGGPFNRLFHSRRIGFDDNELTPIQGGVRAVGRVGGTDYGLLAMRTGAHGARSAENMGVLRLRQQVLNPYSNVGAMVTSRLGGHGGDNIAYGLDASIRPVGDEYLQLQWAQTFDEALNEAGALDAGLVRANWQRRRDVGFTYRVDFARVGRDYEPGLGFQRRKAYTYNAVEGAYGQFMDARSIFQSRGVRMTARQFLRNSDRTPESRELYPRLEFQFKDGASLDVGARAQFESIRVPFSIADVEVPVGDYWFHEATANFSLSRSDTFRGNFTANAGTFYDGDRLGLTLGPVWNASRHLELAVSYSVNKIDFPERDTATTTHLAQVKADVAFDTHLSFSVYAQYNGVDDLASINARMRYHFSEGTDLWIVYNEGLNSARDRNLIPREPLSAGRALSVKYSRTLTR